MAVVEGAELFLGLKLQEVGRDKKRTPFSQLEHPTLPLNLSTVLRVDIMRLNSQLRLELALPDLAIAQLLLALPFFRPELLAAGLAVPIAHFE